MLVVSVSKYVKPPDRMHSVTGGMSHIYEFFVCYILGLLNLSSYVDDQRDLLYVKRDLVYVKNVCVCVCVCVCV
jgi:hypothetical protein